AMSYKVEELLALRDSVSESAVSIDRFADEDVIKEKPLQTSTTPAIAPIAPDKKPSPSPSIKRGKAERLLKEHGSPPGMRVTAGGRVVPSDLPPLSSARFGNNNLKPQSLRSVGSGNTMSAQAQSDFNSTARVQVYGDQPFIWIGDKMFALPSVAPSSTLAALAPPVVEATKHMAEPMNSLQGGYSSGPSALAPAPQRSNTQSPLIGLDLQTLKQQQTFKKQELRIVEQTEVLQASQQNEAWRTTMIEKKRNLIVELDTLRRQISAAEANIPKDNFASSVDSATAPLATFVPQLQQPISQAVYPMLAPNTFPPLLMYPSPFAGYHGVEATQLERNARFLASNENKMTAPQSPNSANRRSHAIEIKPPRDEPKKPIPSALDPKSPTYEPATKADTMKELAPPTPSPAKQSTWRSSREVLSQKVSLSSIDTTDFFPTNTHEHSSTRMAPQIKNAKQRENTVAVPSTPEKAWPASPWNPSSSRSSAAMPLWTETLAKRPSNSSIGAVRANQAVVKSQDRTSLTPHEVLQATFTGSGADSRQSTNHRTGTDENWLICSNKINHVPSTYQEGYQAGYDHVGLPDSYEVLQGFIQGMLQSIEDDKNSRSSNQPTRNLPSAGFTARSASLRGLMSSSTPHDSAVSMSFHRNDSGSVAQENVRSTKPSIMLSNNRRDGAYSPQGSVLDAPISYTLCNETANARESRPRHPSSAMYPGSAGVSDKISLGYRHVAMPTAENHVDLKNPETGVLSRADSSFSGMVFPRQFSGNQLGNRGYGTPISMQRYYPTPKEYGPGGLEKSAHASSHVRPAPNQRLSGLDGAMDDLAGLVVDTRLDELPQRPRQQQQPPSTTESVVTEASCFRPSSSSKGKQKATYSPPKLVSAKGREAVVSSPTNPPGSCKKSGEHSPAKVKLEQVTNKFRRSRKNEPRNMSPEEKTAHTNKWRTRFRGIRADEMKDKYEWIQNNPRKTNDGSANQRR
ncbi:hypothetical protein K504DRAFT_385531, partial [Pleomassaria siparia CBS 279.74]